MVCMFPVSYTHLQTTGKDAQNEYSKGGTKIGMVGAGAAAGAAVGTVVPVVGTEMCIRDSPSPDP